MSPTVLVVGPYRLFFFSREETRIHVHVSCADGEAKFWLEPAIHLANHVGLNQHTLKRMERIIEEYENEIRTAWRRHFQR